MTPRAGPYSAAGMANVLSEEKRQQVVALGRLGWSLRRIETTTGVRRETASAYLRAAGVEIRPVGRWGRSAPRAKPANESTTDLPEVANPDPTGPALETTALAELMGDDRDRGATPGTPFAGAKPANESTTDPRTGIRAGRLSASAEHEELIASRLELGRNAKAIYQDLVESHGFRASYESVKRFVRALKKSAPQTVHPVIRTAPGEEGQVDYGDGPMVRDSSGRYRRSVSSSSRWATAGSPSDCWCGSRALKSGAGSTRRPSVVWEERRAPRCSIT